MNNRDPEHPQPAGPWAWRRARPGLKRLIYEPPSAGPQTATSNAAMLPYWQKNPEAGT